MRVLTIAIVAAFLALPGTAPAQACGAGLHSAKAATADYSAAKKKKSKFSTKFKKSQLKEKESKLPRGENKPFDAAPIEE